MTVLEGLVRRVIFQSGPFFIFEIAFEQEVEGRRAWAVRGYLFGIARLVPGAPLQIKGTWGRHPRFGRQFRVRMWEPWYNDEEGFQTFFTHCIRGSDARSVDAICAMYGDRVLDALASPARVLREVEGNRQDLQSTVLGWEQALAARSVAL